MIENSEKIIEVKNLHKYYGSNHILKGLNFEIESGKLVSVIGRSGCGKTTFLRCLNCLEILDQGSIKIAGISINRNEGSLEKAQEIAEQVAKIRTNVSMPFQGYENVPGIDEDFQIKAHALRSKVGMLFQSFNLFPHMNVLDNVLIAPTIVKKRDKEEARIEAIQNLEKVGMAKYADRMPYELSGGQAQRVAIARALTLKPQVMLYDEPTSALDPELVDEVAEVMMNLNKEGMTQIVVTHSMHFAKKASDYIVYMHDGEIAEMGTPDEIFFYAKNPHTRAYLKIFVD